MESKRLVSIAVIAFSSLLVIAAQAQTFTMLFSFDNTDGANPQAALIQGTDGNFYGTTFGSASSATCVYGGGCGTVFKITPDGTQTMLYSFCSQPNCTDGGNPQAPLVQAANGDFYGTTYLAGANGGGTIFKITPSGALTTVYNFCSQPNCTDGAGPLAGLVQATNRDFYGTTLNGGVNYLGTVFKITPGGTLTTLYSFCSQPNCTDGVNPETGLIQATNGDLYAIAGGTIFKITPGGELTTVYSDGAGLSAGPLLQATNGDFYGTTEGGTTTGGRSSRSRRVAR